MNRRSFVLSWGRKIFFGISWPLTTLIAVLYLKSYILPQNPTDWLYYVTTMIGHYGIANALVYFLLYCPIVLIMPSYYVSRFWSLILILALNIFVLLDAVSFSSYQLHIYSYISKLVMQEGVQNLLGTNPTIIASIGLIALAILIWIRGEKVWRYMQTRFSNPVKNWYLVFIVLCLVAGKMIYHYGNISPRLSSLFPLDMNAKREDESKITDNRTLFYPSSKLVCNSKNSPNLVMIVIKEWSKDQLNPELMPNVFHMKKHAVSFNSHYGVSTDANGGVFSLYYSIPSSYQTTAKEILPAIMTEFDKRQYEIMDIGHEVSNSAGPTEHDEKSLATFKEWAANRSHEVIQPFSLNITLSQHPGDADKMIQDVILTLQSEGFLKDTYVVMTGGYPGSAQLQMPLMVFTPERKAEEIQHATSHYDVIPTLLHKGWGCKNAYEAAGIGKSLFLEGRDWLLISGQDNFKILDLKDSVVTSVTNEEISDVALKGGEAKPNRELVFKALKLNTKYSKPN